VMRDEMKKFYFLTSHLSLPITIIGGGVLAEVKTSTLGISPQSLRGQTQGRINFS
jgi:hypothetical protein